MTTQEFIALVEQAEVLPPALKDVLLKKARAEELTPAQYENIAKSIQKATDADNATTEQAVTEALHIEREMKRDDRKRREEEDRAAEFSFLPEL